MKQILFVIYLLCSQWAASQNISQPKETIRDKLYSEAIRQAERFIDSLQAKQGIPGISVSVGTKDKILWAEGFGLADVENQVPVTVVSKFRIGSVSKSLTTLAVGKLVEEGKLDLDAPITKYGVNFPKKKYPITARQLATHTAGMRHYQNGDGLNCLRTFKTVEESFVIFSSDSLLFQPGTAYNYSTYGYSLLSAVVEKASNTPFLNYMQTAVFAPLGMSNTGADYSDQLVAQRVRFYEIQKGRVVNAEQCDNSYKWAGGGLLSTPSDLVVMSASLLNHSLLKKETVELLFTPQLLSNGVNTNYGLGWRLGMDKKGRKIIHHGGSINGGRTFVMIYPDNNLVIAITANALDGTNINVPEAETLANYFVK